MNRRRFTRALALEHEAFARRTVEAERSTLARLALLRKD
jgi:hypothetical protein